MAVSDRFNLANDRIRIPKWLTGLGREETPMVVENLAAS